VKRDQVKIVPFSKNMQNNLIISPKEELGATSYQGRHLMIIFPFIFG
jgi:hypothetical protein